MLSTYVPASVAGVVNPKFSRFHSNASSVIVTVQKSAPSFNTLILPSGSWSADRENASISGASMLTVVRLSTVLPDAGSTV